jgi:hypothetical protein
MGLLDMFRGKKKDMAPELDPFTDLVLEKLRVGYLVDYDLKTWQVTAHHRYRFNKDEWVDEWELTAGREKSFLERAEDDGAVWTLAKKVPFGKIGSSVRRHILEHDDPPDEVIFEGTSFYLDESAAGYFYPDGKGDGDGKDDGEPLVKWELLDESEETYLTIEQWSESRFEASVGTSVEEYQFTNILPGTPG